MKPADFATFVRLLKERTGLALPEDKGYLLESRVMPIARRRRLSRMEEVAEAVRKGGDGELENDIVEVMTTKESFFFHEKRLFDQFRDVVLPRFLKARAANRHIRIWSAACSVGQEPYSLAMLLMENAAMLNGWAVEIVATDISEENLRKASTGVYSQFEVQRGLPVQLFMKYFTRVRDGWKIDDSIMPLVAYRTFNLLDDMSELGTFDVVFCRNALAYFDPPTKADTLSRMRRQMADDGVLFLGREESDLGGYGEFAPLAALKSVFAVTCAAERRSAG